MQCCRIKQKASAATSLRDREAVRPRLHLHATRGRTKEDVNTYGDEQHERLVQQRYAKDSDKSLELLPEDTSTANTKDPDNYQVTFFTKNKREEARSCSMRSFSMFGREVTAGTTSRPKSFIDDDGAIRNAHAQFLAEDRAKGALAEVQAQVHSTHV